MYLPRSLNRLILIITQSKSAARKLVNKKNIITIKPINKADVLELFKKKLGRGNSDDATGLATALEFMPLAIVQAAAYISQRAPQYSVREYLQAFWKSDQKRTSLLNYKGNHVGEQLRRDCEAKNSILITWQISFDHICKIRPSAAELLLLISFFNRQGIPEALLRSRDEQQNLRQDQKESNAGIEASYSDDDEDNTSQSSTSNRFKEDVLVLRNYSFISVNTDGSTLEMHALVQLATQEWLKSHKQQEQWKQQFIRNLNTELPTGEYKNWIKWQTLFPHAQSAAAQHPKEQNSLAEWALILYKAA
jgi:hypothetical protein